MIFVPELIIEPEKTIKIKKNTSDVVVYAPGFTYHTEDRAKDLEKRCRDAGLGFASFTNRGIQKNEEGDTVINLVAKEFLEDYYFILATVYNQMKENGKTPRIHTVSSSINAPVHDNLLYRMPELDQSQFSSEQYQGILAIRAAIKKQFYLSPIAGFSYINDTLAELMKTQNVAIQENEEFGNNYFPLVVIVPPDQERKEEVNNGKETNSFITLRSVVGFTQLLDEKELSYIDMIKNTTYNPNNAKVYLGGQDKILKSDQLARDLVTLGIGLNFDPNWEHSLNRQYVNTRIVENIIESRNP